MRHRLHQLTQAKTQGKKLPTHLSNPSGRLEECHNSQDQEKGGVGEEQEGTSPILHLLLCIQVSDQGGGTFYSTLYLFDS